jgi:hypothetical protein
MCCELDLDFETAILFKFLDLEKLASVHRVGKLIFLFRKITLVKDIVE